jgi:hypothetical protein
MIEISETHNERKMRAEGNVTVAARERITAGEMNRKSER